MINIFALSSLVLATLHMAVAPASAHGYVSHLPSRQALCRDVPVPGCGDVKYEPQSVEALKGSFKCNGDGVRFHELNEEHLSRPSLLHVDAHSAARHPTWEYFILTEHNTKLASFDDGGAVPPRTVVHQVPLHGYTVRQTILAHWNITDTPATFYPRVDLNINPTNTATAVAGAAAAQQPIGIPLAGPGLGRALGHAPDIITFLIGPLNGQGIEHHETVSRTSRRFLQRHEDYIWKSILVSQTCHVDTDGPFLTQTHIDR
ncbi:hypothetical protein B0H10DRAFT_1968012 [Mycena sp. CBHHK59/15]|nr:hypothetical protein B0H10DRAFT_1968012 [Mycena sp. CBHHK59/15]